MELMQNNGMPYGNQYPPQFPPFPPGMPPNMPPNMMPNMPPGMPPNMPPGMPPGMPPNMPHGMPPNMPPNLPHNMQGGMPPNMTLAMQGGMPPNMPGGMPSNMPNGMPPNMPGGMPPNMPGGMPPNMTSGMPPNMPSGMPPNMPSGMPPNMPSGMPPNMPSGMPPNMPSGMPPNMPPGMPPGMPPPSMPSGVCPASPPPPPPPAARAEFPATPLYDLQQTGELYVGPGGRAAGAGAGAALAAARLGADEAEAVARAKKFAMEQSIKMVLMKQTLAHQQQQMASQRTQVQRQQALALMCRVYVGSISFELKEDTIRLAFLPFGPIKSINMSWDPVTQKHKGFAFVEYEIPEAAQLSLEQMNGVMLGGRNIKVVGRPSNMPQAQAVIDEIQDEAKRYNRIYVASVHPDLAEDDIKNVFEAFGAISYCRLAGAGAGAGAGSSARHKGYGFIEYERLDSCLEAIQSMNLFDLGGQYLRVGRAITPPEALRGSAPAAAPLPAAAAVAAAAATAKIQAIDAVATLQLSKLSALGALGGAALPALGALGAALPPPQVVIPPPPAQVTVAPAPSSAPAAPPGPAAGSQAASSQAASSQAAAQCALQQKLLDNEPDTLQHQESLSISGQSARHLVMQKLLARRASRTVVLRDMVGVEDVDPALHHEIRDECSKHGAVTRLVIYTQPDPDRPHVKVFVQFRTTEEAGVCVGALEGRYFGGRRVRAQLYDQELFDCGDLAH